MCLPQCKCFGKNCEKSEHEMISLLAMNVTPRLFSSVCPKNPPPRAKQCAGSWLQAFLFFTHLWLSQIKWKRCKQSITWLSPILRELSMCEMHYGQRWAVFPLGWDWCGVFCLLRIMAKMSFHRIKKCSFHSDCWEIQKSKLFRDNSELFGNHLWQSFHAL